MEIQIHLAVEVPIKKDIERRSNKERYIKMLKKEDARTGRQVEVIILSAKRTKLSVIHTEIRRRVR